MATTALKIVSRVNDGSYAEYWTPGYVLDSVYQVLGKPVGLDPACNPGIPNVESEHYYKASTDGLVWPWEAETLFLNPPYGKHIGKWTGKLVQEYQAGHTKEAILLVPAKMEVKWVQPLLEYPVCFWKGRVWFETPFGKTPQTQQLFGSALFYFGKRVERLVEVFGSKGKIMLPW